MLRKLKLVARQVNRLDAHHKFYIAVGLSLLALLMPFRNLDLSVRLMSTWITYLMISIFLSWTTILTSNPGDVKYEARAQDSNRKTIFLFIIIAAFASLLAILILLKGIPEQAKEDFSTSILIPLACIMGSWWLVHTIFTLRYADLFYFDSTDEKDNEQNQTKGKGLIFPHTKEPDYLDFTYFSFVIGMTFQVSDIQITSRRIRRMR